MVIPSADNFHIPFETHHSFVRFQSLVPTDEELNDLPWLQITDEHWDPTSVSLTGPHSKEEEEEWVRLSSL